MFDLFTDRARRVILYSREAAEKLLQISIDTEHILMGLLREKTGVAADIFNKRGLDTNVLINDIKKMSVQGRNLMIKGSLPFSPMGKTVLEAGCGGSAAAGKQIYKHRAYPPRSPEGAQRQGVHAPRQAGL
ncbi:MAG: hypothetical protein LRY50_02570 [Geovibrio sp.]|nr:hypothetical protein [Geovibrio sp.]